MGDCGFIDEDNNLWFCGRKVERVITQHKTLFTEPCERIFKTHPRIKRCALIGLGAAPNQTPALVVELNVNTSHEALSLTRQLRDLALSHSATQQISRFYFKAQFPVDVRHNAKIHRLTLAKWAETQNGYSV